MICPTVIASIISDHSCDTDYDASQVDLWLDDFDERVQILMIADYLIQVNHLGIKCMGDNCSRFLVSRNKAEFDKLRIESYIQELGLSNEDINNIAKTLKQYSPRFYARGHFIFSAVLCFVNQEVSKICGKKTNISNDAFRTLILNLFKECCSHDSQIERLTLQTEIAAQEVVELISKPSTSST